MTKFLNSLNEEQRRAVEFRVKSGKVSRKHPVIINAGAGAGKTLTLAAMIARIIDHGVQPDQILAVVFTNKAAKSLKTRISACLNEANHNAQEQPTCSTFHALAVSLLLKYGPSTNVGLPESWSLCEKQDCVAIFHDLLRREPFRTSLKGLNAKIAFQIYGYQLNSKRPLQKIAKRFGVDVDLFHLQSLFLAYAGEMDRQHLVDFDRLLTRLEELLRDPRVGPKIRKRFKYVFVDEFQDTNALQLSILRLLCPNGRGVTIVGDEFAVDPCLSGRSCQEFRLVRDRVRPSCAYDQFDIKSSVNAANTRCLQRGRTSR